MTPELKILENRISINFKLLLKVIHVPGMYILQCIFLHFILKFNFFSFRARVEFYQKPVIT